MDFWWPPGVIEVWHATLRRCCAQLGQRRRITLNIGKAYPVGLSNGCLFGVALIYVVVVRFHDG